MSHATHRHSIDSDVYSEFKTINAILVKYLSNLLALEEHSKLSPNKNNAASLERSESELMFKQEVLIQKLKDTEVTNINDAIKVLNAWVSEEVIADKPTHQQQLVMNVHKFLIKQMQ